MSATLYSTPQRVSTNHVTRFFRRVYFVSGSGQQETAVRGWFEARALLQGERIAVYAQFAGASAWGALSASFTLWAGAAPAAGYTGAAAALTVDGSGRLYTASAVVDLTPEAAHPLADGIYIGEFYVTTSDGQIVAARGEVAICSGSGEPDGPEDYDTSGGLA